MFDRIGVTQLYLNHKKTLQTLNALEDVLNERFYDMALAVECVALTAISGEAMVMIGPPGTAKSRLIRAFCNLLGLLSDEALSGKDITKTGDGTAEIKQDDAYFEYLLTQFTEPSELFGFYDLSRLEEGLVRDEKGMMQHSTVVFLDEVFNASSAILNSLLTFMNERKFHDRGRVQNTSLQLLFSATNHPPSDPGLGAVFDRFLLRCWIDNVDVNPDDFLGLIQAGWKETHATELSAETKIGFNSLLDDLEALRADMRAMTKAGTLWIDPDSQMVLHLAQLAKDLDEQNLVRMSNRRVIKFTGIILFKALLRAARNDAQDAEITLDDFSVITNFSIDKDADHLVEKIWQNLNDRQ